MPSEGMYQQPAGKAKNMSCDCKVPMSKKMRPIVKHFTIEGPEYKGNAVLNAQK